MEAFKIGRGQENDIVLAHSSVSRLHALAERDTDGNWIVKDLNSSYGTKIFDGKDWRTVSRIAVTVDTPICFGEHVTTLRELMAQGARNQLSAHNIGSADRTEARDSSQDPHSPAQEGGDAPQYETPASNGMGAARGFAALLLRIAGVAFAFGCAYVGGWTLIWRDNLLAFPTLLKNARLLGGSLTWSVQEGAAFEFNGFYYGVGVVSRFFESPVVSWVLLVAAFVILGSAIGISSEKKGDST